MYSQIVFHRKVNAFELLAEAISQELALAQFDVVYRSYDAIVKDVGTPAFLGFDDSYFFSRIHSYYAQENVEDKLKDMIDNFLHGRPPELVREEKALVADPDSMPQSYRRLRTVVEHPDLLPRVCERARIDPQQVVPKHLVPLEFLPVGSDVRLGELIERGTEYWKETVRTLPCLYNDVSKSTEYLAMDESSILAILSNYRLYSLRIFLVDGKDGDVQRLNRELEAELRTLP